MNRKKYIVEASDDVKKVIAMGVTHGGAIWTDTTDIGKLEELNSDYINEHFGGLQDTAYKKGLHDGESKCGYCNEYQRGLDDAWEAARKIVDMWKRIDSDEILTIFGITERTDYSAIKLLFDKQTAAEAIAKLKAYEEKQKADDEIKVGDEVMWYREKIVITCLYHNDGFNWCDGINKDGRVFNVLKEKVTKTGRHVNIEKILEEMKE